MSERKILSRTSVIESIRAGYTTSPAIAKHLDFPVIVVARTLKRLLELSRIFDVGPAESVSGRAGRPPTRYRVNEDYVRKNREKSAETRAKIAAAVDACWRDPEFRARQKVGFAERRERLAINPPAILPRRYRSAYREIARVLGREVAELYAAEAAKVTEAKVAASRKVPDAKQDTCEGSSACP